MTDTEIRELIEMFGDSLPNPEQYPERFLFYVSMYRFYKGEYK